MHGTGKPLGRHTKDVPKSALVAAKAVAVALDDAQTVLVLGHTHADGDVAGSSLALAAALREAGKQVTVYNEYPYPQGFDWLPGAQAIVHSLADDARFDATVVVDAADPMRCGAHFPDADRRGTFIWMDHHHIETPPGDINYIDLTAAAVGEQVAEVMDAMGIPLSTDSAQCIYASLVADTGGFRYGNTSARAFALAARLVAAGVNAWTMTERIYESQDEGRTRLLGQTLTSFDRSKGGKFAVATLTQQDLDQAGAEPPHIKGLVNHLRAIRGIEVAALVHEVQGGTKVILRSKGNVSCADVAQAFGEKGHTNAAGFTVPEEPKRVASRVRSVFDTLEAGRSSPKVVKKTSKKKRRSTRRARAS